MLIFALDSTAAIASVAICEDDRTLATYTVQSGNNHSKTLLPMAQSLLRDLSLTPDNIDLFACTAGPGSFTGVRIGAATIKGLAFGTSKPCVGVSSLEALAYNISDLPGLICPVINARKFIYSALFTTKDGELIRLSEDDVFTIEELDQRVLRIAEEQGLSSLALRVVGDGYSLAHRALPSFAAASRLYPTSALLREQNACSIAQLARKKYALGQYDSDRTLSPVYLRPCQAERDREERLQANQSQV